ncbi:hypothetical protein Taro_030060, partial [Colocasia esculenta]|nr:hypothetical protein [Colocasia esculenta]
MTCYIFICINRDMVRGGRSRTVATSVGRGTASSSTSASRSATGICICTQKTIRVLLFILISRELTYIQFYRDCLPVHARLPSDRDCLPVHARRPSDRDCLSVHARRPSDRDCLPVHARRPSDRRKIDPSPASRYITTLVHTHIPGPVDAWRDFPVQVRDLLFDMFTRRFVFTRPEDLPRARAVWEITAQTNLRKSMWEVRDKAMKTTGNRDPMAWVDYGPVWLRRDYWESLCARWATGPWQQRSQAAIRNRATQPEKNVHTSGS